MMNDDQFVEVIIFGERYKLVSTYKDQERILRIASLVNERMESLSKRFPSYTKAKIAILTSLNLADELFKLHAEQDQTNEKLNSLLSIMDQTLSQ